MIPILRPGEPFPPPEHALTYPDGLLAAGGDLAPGTLIDAYSRGIFPWSAEGQPLLWWSPDPRMVLPVAEFRVRRSLAKRVRQRPYAIRCDTAFRAVIESCSATARPGQDGTWITAAMIDAYCRLHTLGYAHSVEAWDGDRLVGGLYGIALGRVFFGESMFTHASDASKVALVHLVAKLVRLGVPLIDCQQQTDHLATFGARPVPRSEFARLLAELIHSHAPPGGWAAGALDPDPPT